MSSTDAERACVPHPGHGHSWPQASLFCSPAGEWGAPSGSLAFVLMEGGHVCVCLGFILVTERLQETLIGRVGRHGSGAAGRSGRVHLLGLMAATPPHTGSLLIQAPDPLLGIDLERSEKGLPGATKGLTEGFTPQDFGAPPLGPCCPSQCPPASWSAPLSSPYRPCCPAGSQLRPRSVGSRAPAGVLEALSNFQVNLIPVTQRLTRIIAVRGHG